MEILNLKFIDFVLKKGGGSLNWANKSICEVFHYTMYICILEL